MRRRGRLPRGTARSMKSSRDMKCRATDLTMTNATVGAQRTTWVSVRKCHLWDRESSICSKNSQTSCGTDRGRVRDRVARAIWGGNLLVLHQTVERAFSRVLLTTRIARRTQICWTRRESRWTKNQPNRGNPPRDRWSGDQWQERGSSGQFPRRFLVRVRVSNAGMSECRDESGVNAVT
jgi:hypothetical protein